jgi:capsular polysaccharide biosynthesis protein
MNNNNDKYYESGLISVSELILFLWKKKILIFFITIFFGAYTVFWSLNLEDKYTSTTLLMVNETSSSKLSKPQNQLGGGIASLLSGGLTGLAVDQKTYVIETIKSRVFIESIADTAGVMEKVMATKSYSKSSEEIQFNEDIFNVNDGKWIEGKPSNNDFYNSFLSDFRISRDETGFIKMTYIHESPIFAKDMLNLIIEKLNRQIKLEDLNNAENAINYLVDILNNTQQMEIRQSVNNLIEENMKIKVLANINEFYLLKPLDPPFIPEFKTYPARTLMVLLGLITGLILSISGLIIKRYIFSLKDG